MIYTYINDDDDDDDDGVVDDDGCVHFPSKKLLEKAFASNDFV